MEVPIAFACSMGLKYLTNKIKVPVRRHPPFYTLGFAIVFSIMSISLSFTQEWWPVTMGGHYLVVDMFKDTTVKHQWLIMFRFTELVIETCIMVYNGIAKGKWQYDMLFHHAVFLAFVHFNPFPALTLYYISAAELSIIPLLLVRTFTAYNYVKIQNMFLMVAFPCFLYFRIVLMSQTNYYYLANGHVSIFTLSSCLLGCQLFWFNKMITMVTKSIQLPKKDKNNSLNVIKSSIEATLHPKDFKSQLLHQISLLINKSVSGDANLFEIGLDSIKFIRLRAFIKEEFGLLLDPELLATYDTVDALNKWYCNRRNSKQSIVLMLENGEPSRGQERLFVLLKKQPTDAYNVPFLVKFNKMLDTDLFINSLKDTIRHHKLLHATFKPDASYTLKSKKLTIPFFIKSKDEANSYCKDMAKHPFNLEEGPLYIFNVLQVDQETWLFGNIHHLVCDGWSIGVFIKDVGLRYSNKPLVQVSKYEDYVKYDKSIDKEDGSKFWQTYLQDIKPFSLASTSDAIGVGQRNEHVLENASQLISFAGQNRTTPFNCFMSMFTGLFGYYTNEPDVVLGTVFSNRMRPEDMETVGFFVRTLPFRQAYNSSETYIELLQKVKKTSVSLMVYQDHLIESKEMAAIKILIVVQNNSLSAEEFKAEADFSTIAPCYTQFDLVIQLFHVPTKNQYSCIWDYNTSKYAQPLIQQLALHFTSYYNAVLSNPHFVLGNAPILNKVELKTQIMDWNDLKLTSTCKNTLHAQFIEICKLYPNKVALVHKNTRLTFKALDRKSNALANTIRSLNITSTNKLIGLHILRSVDVIIGILGIWKSGNGYLPLDPSLPIDRLQTIASSAKLDTIVYNKHPDWFKGQLVEIDSHKASDELLEPINDVNSIAYCLFTSGSTGMPKGVMISHFNTISFFHGFHQMNPFDHTDVWAMNHTFIFDLSVGELVLGLLTGCKLVMVDKEELLDHEKYWLLTTAEELSMIWIPINVFLGMTKITYAPKRFIRYFFAGEKIDITKIPQWVFDCGLQIVVGYGPTETTIICSSSVVRSPNDILNNLGSPFPDTQMYILNKSLEPCPIGVTGEVYIGGSLVGMGYLNQLELTQTKFIKNPFHAGLMYQSGDLARYLPNGQFQFAERSDFQVKLRGFRIELGEIENCLDKHASIERCVAIVNKQTKEEDSFIAVYVILKKNQILDRTLLFEFCRKTLPYYMVPSTYTQLQAFPVTPTGKFNRKGLPEPSINDRISATGSKPSSRTEVIIANRMESILNLSNNSLLNNDDFFLKGGNSLKAMKFLNLVNEEFKLTLPLKDVFEYTTISSFAKHLDSEMNLTLNSTLTSITKQLNDKLALSSCQNRLYIHQTIYPDSATYNVPLLFTCKMPPDQMKEKLITIGKQHDSLRTSIKSDDKGTWQHIDAKFTLLMTEIFNPLFFHSQVKISFDLSQSPLFKVFYLKSNTNYQYLFLAHHIIIDEWSWELILSMIFNPKSDVKVSQYKDFVLYEQSRLETITISTEFWQNYMLDSVCPKLEECFIQDLPSNGQIISHSIQIEQLKFISNSLSISPYVFLMGTFGLFLMKMLDEKDVLVATPVSLRDNAAFESTIGFFVNTVPLRIHVVDDISLLIFYQRIKQNVLNILPHSFVPFESITKQSIPYCFVAQESLNSEHLTTQIIHNSTCKFNITMLIDYSLDGTINCHLEYDSTKYSSIVANEMMTSFTRLLQDVSQLQFNRTLQSLSLKSQGLSCTPYNSLTCIPVCCDVKLDDMANLYPFKPAIQSIVNSKLTSITYEQLVQCANYYAFEIQQQCKPQSFVGIYMERRSEMLISILATWKANCIYVPLDPKLPDDRINFIIKQANISTILCIDPSSFKTSFISIKTTNYAPTPPQLDKDPSNTAYCLFTSGSTGTPKGVLISHANLISYITSSSYYLHITSNDVGSMMHTFTFDVSLQESMTPLMNGCTLHLFNDEDIFHPEQLWDIITLYKINHFSVPISVFYKMCKFESKVDHLIRIQLGGENLDKHKLPHWIKQLKNIQIWFMYGPTEATVACTTLHLINYEDQRHLIGRPMPGYYIWILDRNKQILPVGMYGELHVSGCGVGKGYLDSTKTAERFYDCQLFNKTHQMYNTGDIAKLTHDGFIQFLGRKDFQVKVRGFRIELNEIELVCAKVEGVEDALCVVKEDRLEPYIAVYIIGIGNHSLVLKSCQQHLPYYMVPSCIISVKDYPLQINGKVNLKALPIPKDIDFLLNTMVTGPANDQEQFVLDQFATILNKKSELISVVDNFFSIGGSSTLAAKLSTLLKVKITIIFKYQSIREISNYLNNTVKSIEFDLEVESSIEDTQVLHLSDDYLTKKLTRESIVLLTGSSGFVGLFLLGNLSHKCKVICPLRNSQSTIEKLKQQQSKYMYLKDINYNNVEFVELSSIYDYKVDFVIHNAAQVNFVDSYESMKPFNVDFTRDLLHHCYLNNQPKFIYISTLSCFNLSSYKKSPNAYVLSKYVAETICTKYKALGYPINCFRIGQITGDSIYGEYYANDLISTMLKSIIKSRLVPDIHYDLEWTPVDIITSEIISNLSQTDFLLNMVPSIVYTVKDLLKIVPQSKLMPWKQWKLENELYLGVYFNVLADDFEMKKTVMAYEWKSFSMSLELIKHYLDSVGK